MKSISKFLTALLLTATLSTPALAESRGGNGGSGGDRTNITVDSSAGAIAGAAAQAIVNATSAAASANAMAGDCGLAMGVQVLGAGISASVPKTQCHLMKELKYLVPLGVFTPAEARAIALEVGKVKLNTVSDSYASSKSTTGAIKQVSSKNVAPTSVASLPRGLASCQMKNGKVMVTRGFLVGDARYEAAKQECVQLLS